MIKEAIKLLKNKIVLDLRNVPVESQTEQICLEYVTLNGLNLEFAKYKSRAVCLAAVRENGMALQFVDKESQSIEIVSAAVGQTEKAFKYFKYITEE